MGAGLALICSFEVERAKQRILGGKILKISLFASVIKNMFLRVGKIWVLLFVASFKM